MYDARVGTIVQCILNSQNEQKSALNNRSKHPSTE